MSWLVLLGIWLLAHPYAGIRHDGIFYAVDALYRLDRTAFEQDLFFLAGSPFKASVFGPIYAAVVDRLGSVPASWAMYLVAQLLWAGAAIAWSARFVPERVFLVASSALILLPHAYGSGLVLKLAEFQVTARSFAEPLTLLGLLLVASGRRACGFGTLIAAALVHPIMALPGWIAGSWLALSHLGLSARARVLCAAAGFAVVLVFASIGFLGFVDDGWLDATRLRNPFILPREWDAAYGARIFTPILVLLAASRQLGGALGRMCAAIAIAALSGLLLTVIGDSQRAALILQAQPWRSVWLACWAAPFAALAAACQLWATDRGRGLMFLGAVPAAALSFFAMIPGSAWLPLLHAATLHLRRLVGPHPRWETVGRAWIAAIAAVLAVSMAAIFYAALLHGDSSRLAGASAPHELWARLAGWLLAPLALALLGRFALLERSRGLGWAAGGLLFAASLALMDARSDELRWNEARIASGMPELRAAVVGAEMIFWPENVALTWLALGRPGYVSNEQMAAQMFDARISGEGRRRMALVGALGGRDGVLDFHEVRRPWRSPPVPDGEAIRRVCADQRKLAIVLSSLPDGGASRAVPAGDDRTVWVVRCDTVD